MDLVETVVKAPADGIVSPVVAGGSVLIRTARWTPAFRQGGTSESRGTVLICNGRSEFIEKYYEVVEELRQRGFHVVVFDWRGQGRSDRLLSNPRKGHVGTFSDYEQDLAAIQQQILEPFCPRPWFALAHSMGGPILLNFAVKRPGAFQRIVLSAPMIDLARLPVPNMLRVVARWVSRIGLGRCDIPVGRRRSLFLSTFAGNVLTSDATRFARTAALLEAEPRLAIGTPTIGWLNAAFDSMTALEEERFGRDFMTPTLVIMPRDDAVVDGRAVERFASRLRTATLVMVPQSRHEVLMERDDLRQQFWSAFDEFVPGSAQRPESALRRDRSPYAEAPAL